MHIDPAAVLNWITSHYSFAGWLLVAGLIWRAARFATRIEAKFSTGFSHLEKMATNELPHVQAATESLATSMAALSQDFKGMREDIREIMQHHYKK